MSFRDTHCDADESESSDGEEYASQDEDEGSLDGGVQGLSLSSSSHGKIRAGGGSFSDPEPIGTEGLEPESDTASSTTDTAAATIRSGAGPEEASFHGSETWDDADRQTTGGSSRGSGSTRTRQSKRTHSKTREEAAEQGASVSTGRSDGSVGEERNTVANDSSGMHPRAKRTHSQTRLGGGGGGTGSGIGGGGRESGGDGEMWWEGGMN